MTTVQVMLVGLEAELDRLVPLLGDLEPRLDVADDLEEACELLAITGADLLVVNRSLAGLDPVDAVARCYADIGRADLPFVFLEPDRPEDASVVRRIEGGEFSVDRPGEAGLGPLLRAAVAGEEAPIQATAASPELKQQMLEVGFNDGASHEGRSFVVQTEVHLRDGRVAVRVTVFEGGVLTSAETHKVELGADPLGELRARAAEIHERAVAAIERGEIAQTR